MAGLISAIDSYFSYIRSRLVAINAQVLINGQLVPQPIASIVQARDWPNTPPIEGALYLLVQSVVPLSQGSVAQTHYQYVCQWTWLLIGQDIPQNGRKENRGDRYRASLQVMTNLRQANYPGWCQKMEYAVDTVAGTVTSTPVTWPTTNIEMVRFDPVRFISQPDEPSGVSYGIGAVSLYAWDDVWPVADVPPPLVFSE